MTRPLDASLAVNDAGSATVLLVFLQYAADDVGILLPAHRQMVFIIDCHDRSYEFQSELQNLLLEDTTYQDVHIMHGNVVRRAAQSFIETLTVIDQDSGFASMSARLTALIGLQVNSTGLSVAKRSGASHAQPAICSMI